MAIPRVNLNIDPSGYAGPMLPPMGLPSTFGGGGGNFGLPAGMMSLLRRKLDLQNAMARAELDRMREETQQYGKQSRLQNWMMKEEAKRAFAPRQAASDFDPRMELWKMSNSPMMPSFGQLGMEKMGRQQALQLMLGGPGGGTGIAPYEGGGGEPSFARAAMNARLAQSMTGGAQLPGPGRSFTPPARADLRAAKAKYGKAIAPGTVLGGRKKGTLPGTIPKTGTYQLHEGEIVVSEPQVDEPLLAYLVEDKLRKGITKTTPKGSMTYRRGSIGTDIKKGDKKKFDPMSVKTERGPTGFFGYGPQYWRDLLGAYEAQVEPYKKLGPAEATARQLGEGFGWLGRMGSAGADILGGAGQQIGAGYEKATTGVEPTAPAGVPNAGMAEPLPMERYMPLPQIGLDPEAQYTRDFEVASSRARGGDFGTPEMPLTLRGEGREPLVRGDEHLPPEQRYFAPEEPEWRRAESQRLMAQTSRMQADRIRSTLMNPNSNIDPDTRKELLNEAKFLDTVAQATEDRFQAQKDKWLEAVTRTNEASAEVEKERVKAEAKGFEMGETTRRQQIGKLDDHFERLVVMLLDPKNAKDMEDEDREAIINALVGNAIEKAYLEGEELDPETARQMVLAQLSGGQVSEE